MILYIYHLVFRLKNYEGPWLYLLQFGVNWNSQATEHSWVRRMKLWRTAFKVGYHTKIIGCCLTACTCSMFCLSTFFLTRKSCPAHQSKSRAPCALSKQQVNCWSSPVSEHCADQVKSGGPVHCAAPAVWRVKDGVTACEVTDLLQGYGSRQQSQACSLLGCKDSTWQKSGSYCPHPTTSNNVL